MKPITRTNLLYRLKAATSIMTLACLAVPNVSMAAIPELLDDFDNDSVTAIETPRIVFTDKDIGGGSDAKLTTEDGILRVEGKLVPARGQPAFISLVLLLSMDGTPQDLSGYTGIRIRVRVLKGGLQVLAASTEIQNYDYHMVAVRRSRDFIEMKVPFSDLKRVWSEQTPLNMKTISSINLVASGTQPGAFLYEIDEIGFY